MLFFVVLKAACVMSFFLLFFCMCLSVLDLCYLFLPRDYR